MNKFLTFAGLQPVYLGDIDFMQEAVRETFLQLLVGLTGESSPSCILKKATAQEDGVICLDGEIMPYKAYTGTSNGLLGSPTYSVKTSRSGSRVFKSGVTHECLETRYAQESMTIGGSNLPTFDELLFKRITFFSAIVNVDAEVQYRVTVLGNIVEYEVMVNFANDVTTEYLCSQVGLSFAHASAALQSPKYCAFIAEADDALQNIPAKVILTADSNTNYVKMSIKIPPTTFVAGTKGSLTFTLVK